MKEQPGNERGPIHSYRASGRLGLEIDGCTTRVDAKGSMYDYSHRGGTWNLAYRSMKTAIATLALSLTAGLLATAQGQENPGARLHRDFPNVQVIRPSFPPWSFNYDSKRWEREQGLALPALVDRQNLDLLSLTPRPLPEHRARRLHYRRARHHSHRQPSR